MPRFLGEPTVEERDIVRLVPGETASDLIPSYQRHAESRLANYENRLIPLLKPVVPPAKLPAGDLKDITPEVPGDGLKLLWCHLVGKGCGFPKQLFNDSKAGF